MVSNDCVGVISVVAFSADQQKRIKEHSREISEYVRYVSNIFVSKIVGGQNDGDDFSKILLTLIENLDQGVMVLDENGNLRLVNEVALKQLNCTQEDCRSSGDYPSSQRATNLLTKASAVHRYVR